MSRNRPLLSTRAGVVEQTFSRVFRSFLFCKIRYLNRYLQKVPKKIPKINCLNRKSEAVIQNPNPETTPTTLRRHPTLSHTSRRAARAVSAFFSVLWCSISIVKVNVLKKDRIYFRILKCRKVKASYRILNRILLRPKKVCCRACVLRAINFAGMR